MKLSIISRTAGVSLVIAASFFFFSCSKEALKENTVNKTMDNFRPAPSVFIQPDRGTGSFSITILPVEAMPELTLYNNNISKFEYLASKGGTYFFRGVPAGSYTLYIHPTSTKFKDYYISDIVIVGGTTLEYGTVILQ